MNRTKVSFTNSDGNQLTGYLEFPLNQEPHSFVLFAHCFTCNKNFFAVKNISRALTNNGFGVLRFDFAGLGESEGEFSETNFSGNVEDLISAADYLKQEHKAPELLVGHSLGGAAVLFAAKEIPSVKAVTTIGAPSSPDHVKHRLKSGIQEIRENGLASVNVGGRDFTIKKQFLDDLDKKELHQLVGELDLALLIMHAPQDLIVEIANAEKLYLAAKHPKSFVSLDGADHLLSDTKDSVYAGEVIAAWAQRYLHIPKKEKLKTTHEVIANLQKEGFTTEMKAGDHFFISDEPEDFGGKDFGPSPYDFLSSALAACTSMTIQMYARRKNWALENVETHVTHKKEHVQDCEHCEDKSAKIDVFEREIVLRGHLDQPQTKKLMEIANKCPVHRTLCSKVHISSNLRKTMNDL